MLGKEPVCVSSYPLQKIHTYRDIHMYIIHTMYIQVHTLAQGSQHYCFVTVRHDLVYASYLLCIKGCYYIALADTS